MKLYPELKQRDAEWLKAILKGEKYQYIAIEYKMSVGSVKNRFKYIFSILECGDRRGFITSYADYEIIFHDEKISDDATCSNKICEGENQSGTL